MRAIHWLGLAAALRLAGAFSNLSWGHPDEWFQTVEFANSIAFGFSSQTQEYHLHMRNLSWPALLSGPLRIAHALSPGDPWVRMLAVKLFTASLDVTALAFAALLIGTQAPTRRNWAWGMLVLPWIFVGEAARPGQEHLSALASLCAVGLLAVPSPTRACLVLAGAACAWIGVLRYPSGLFGAGLLLAMVLRATRLRAKPDRRSLADLGWLLGGVGLGVASGGIADWLFYGRPYESLWMYAQYNVFSGTGELNFGTQTSHEAYLPFLRGSFGGPLILIGISGLVCIPVGIGFGLTRLEPWAWGAVSYLVGHLAIGHKEPRFLAPLLPWLFWAFYVGAERLVHRLPKVREVIWLLRLAVGITFAANALFVARAVWGERWRASWNYLEIGGWLRERPSCAVVTVRRPVGALLPWTAPTTAPETPLGFFPAEPHAPMSASLGSRPLIWTQRAPGCSAGSRVLLQPTRPEPFWEKSGCELLPSGVLGVFPRSAWARLLRRNWVSAPWYDCPASVLSLFPKQETRLTLARGMRRIEELPPLGLRGRDFLERAWSPLKPESDPSLRDGTLGDW